MIQPDGPDTPLATLARTIAAGDAPAALRLLAASPALARAGFAEGATRQAATIARLIESGADPDALDKSGVTPLHRAVRTRCAAAVKALLDHGADVQRRNNSGSTPMLLATVNSGRGGTGSPEAKAQQVEIIRLLEQHGARR
jgi:hypothetical protein